MIEKIALLCCGFVTFCFAPKEFDMALDFKHNEEIEERYAHEIDNRSVDSSIDESTADDSMEMIDAISKKFANKMAQEIAIILHSSIEEKKAFKNMIYFILRDECHGCLNMQRVSASEDVRAHLDSLNIINQIKIPVEQIDLIQTRFSQEINSLQEAVDVDAFLNKDGSFPDSE